MPYWMDTIRVAMSPRRIRWPGLRKAVPAAVDLLLTWMERREQRRHLLQLDARMLKDIGVNREEAVEEARKPFWQD